MKKILLPLITLAVVGITAKVQAQCTVSNVGFSITNTQSVAGGCQVTFDFNFTINNNNGNKIVVIQAWMDADYPDYWQCNVVNHTSTVMKAPKADDLKKNGTGPLPFLNLAFNNDLTPPVAFTSYGPDGSVPLTIGYLVNRSAPNAAGDVVMTLTGVTVTVPAPCGTAVSIRADLWSSQSSVNSSWTPHCANCNNLFAFNYPDVDASLSCGTPRTYQAIIHNINTNQTIVSSWQAYRDDNANGILEIGTDPLVSDSSTHFVTIQPGSTFSSVPAPYAGNGVQPSLNKNLFIVVTTQGLLNTQTAIATPPCISTLPVNFKSFTAARNHSTVKATWVTSTEINNSGFAVERLIGSGGWKQIAFVPSQAQGGNSSTDLTYTYNDLNSTNGISQYRIKQVDLDNKSKFSEIRAVRGEGQLGKTIVFPNPSNDGRVNVVFEDATATRDISVMDMSGRLIKQMKGVTNNTIQIDNLTPGMYSLRVVVRETGDQVVEKVVINKR